MAKEIAVLNKSLDYVNVIACMLDDVYNALGITVSPRYKRLTTTKVENRLQREGYGFLTKSLPRLGKSLDCALLGKQRLDCTGFRKEPGTQIPKLFGNLFRRVFDLNGEVLPNPCVKSIASLRQLCFNYYKYELPRDEKLDQKVLEAFKETEVDVVEDVKFLTEKFGTFGGRAIPPNLGSLGQHCQIYPGYKEEVALLCRARKLVYKLFSGFDISGIIPRHGPGAVSTKERGNRKYVFDRMNPRAQMVFPFDEYFHVNATHLCDNLRAMQSVKFEEASARVVLVPKDSRGPRVISCEPLENQWLQQGLMRSMVQWIESHPLTRLDIRFTDQEPNRMAAIAGSYHGELATLDLKEASDRVSVWLVEQLFPEPLLGALLATRSLSTVLPSGEVLPLAKFAPMGSATCFPVLATCVWALLRAGDAGADGKTVFVYGDDVIVETAQAAHAIEQLETFGLHVNRDKSCTTGLFRESCGMDAYYGVDVTPVRFRTEWSSKPAAGPYESWVAYANQLFSRDYHIAARYIAGMVEAVYGPVPVNLEESFRKATDTDPDGPRWIFKAGYPSFTFDSMSMLTVPTRNSETLPMDHVAHGYQRLMKRVRTVISTYVVDRSCDEWGLILKYFSNRQSGGKSKLRGLPESAIESIVWRLAQMSRRSLLSVADAAPVLPSNAELAGLADAAVDGDADHAVLAYVSSLTGVSLPVVQQCMRLATIRHAEKLIYSREELTGVRRATLPADHTSAKKAKLAFAWR
jgi:hypothetical protein